MPHGNIVGKSHLRNISNAIFLFNWLHNLSRSIISPYTSLIHVDVFVSVYLIICRIKRISRDKCELVAIYFSTRFLLQTRTLQISIQTSCIVLQCHLLLLLNVPKSLFYKTTTTDVRHPKKCNSDGQSEMSASVNGLATSLYVSRPAAHAE